MPPGPPPSSRDPDAAVAAAARRGQRSRPAPAPQQATPGAPPAGGQRPQPASLPPPNNETVVEPPPNKIANPTAVFSGLDKITGRIISFDVAINETVRFGALQVTPRACYSRPPTEAPTTDGFIEVDELTLQGEIKRIFSGWMFAASPGLNAVEHPIYDVWLTDCKGAPQPTVAEAPPRRRRRSARRSARQQPARRKQRSSAQQQPPPPTAASSSHAVAATAAATAR